jgi:hypothetical protein
MKRNNIFYGLTLGVIFTAVGFSCAKNDDEVTAASRKLYIATGICYSGTGFTAPTIADVGQTFARLDISSRQYEVVHDYANSANNAAGSYANGVTDGGDGHIYVAVENATNTGNRKIDKIVKAAYGERVVWQSNTAILASGGVLKGISRATDKGVLFAATTAIERYDATPTRQTKGPITAPTAWGAALGNDGASRDCSANNTRITDMVALPSAVSGDQIGKFIYTHSAVGQMDVGVVSKNGGNAAGTCLANVAGGATLTEATTADASLNETLSVNATPTSVVFVSTGAGTGKVLVAYASSTNNGVQAAAASLNNALVMYDFTENTAAPESATLTNGVVLYNNDAYFAGVSAMAYDSTTNSLFASRVDTNSVVGGVPNGYIIERFTIDLTTPSATRVLDTNNSSFEEANSFTNCVTSMFVAD